MGRNAFEKLFSASISGSENSELHAASAVRETIKSLILQKLQVNH